MTDDGFVPGLPVDLIRAAYAAAPGNEIESGKFFSPESSAALVANAFGFFLGRPAMLPPIPGSEREGWPALSIQLEAIVRFPWSGGRHPCLDVLIATKGELLGVESKRFEPFRKKTVGDLSDAYWRPVWGDRMRGYESVRDALREGTLVFSHLDAAQLVKHAFGLRTAVQATARYAGRRAVLIYLFAEPEKWPDGRTILPSDRAAHRNEIAEFARRVAKDEVAFVSCSYRDLLETWKAGAKSLVRAHAVAIEQRFAP